MKILVAALIIITSCNNQCLNTERYANKSESKEMKINIKKNTFSITIREVNLIKAGLETQMNINWELSNETTEKIFVLWTIPFKTVIQEITMLDHSSLGEERSFYANEDTGFRFIVLQPKSALILNQTYSLVVPTDLPQLKIFGRFGVNTIPPDESWEEKKNWKAVQQWQTVYDTAPYVIKTN